MDIGNKIEVFGRLGKILSLAAFQQSCDVLTKYDLQAAAFESVLDKAMAANAWFTKESVYKMLYTIGVSLYEEDLRQWMGMYDLQAKIEQKKVAVVMAGNIPAVGFHDFLSVLMAGHKVLAKLSSDDQYLIPGITELLIEMDPTFADLIEFSDGPLKNFDAVIATGSNNTSRYFDYYFGKYPHIIRKNRNALAVLSGNEDRETLVALGEDIFTYYGLGCRNVSRMFIPKDYDLDKFFPAMEVFSSVADHHKYKNNYDYNKSIFLVNGEDHFDNGFLLLKEEAGMASPVSVLHYGRYTDLKEVNDYIRKDSENIQCVISDDPGVESSIPPGTGQYPRLWDYADGVDTMGFLLNL